GVYVPSGAVESAATNSESRKIPTPTGFRPTATSLSILLYASTMKKVRLGTFIIACWMLHAGCRANAPTSSIQHPTSKLQYPTSDLFGDGPPDFLRLDGESDRRAFRHWLTFLAESQYYRQPGRLPREINDCAALIRFAYRQALREHDGAWASELDLDAVPNQISVQKFAYPRTPLG